MLRVVPIGPIPPFTATCQLHLRMAGLLVVVYYFAAFSLRGLDRAEDGPGDSPRHSSFDRSASTGQLRERQRLESALRAGAYPFEMAKVDLRSSEYEATGASNCCLWYAPAF